MMFTNVLRLFGGGGLFFSLCYIIVLPLSFAYLKLQLIVKQLLCFVLLKAD